MTRNFAPSSPFYQTADGAAGGAGGTGTTSSQGTPASGSQGTPTGGGGGSGGTGNTPVSFTNDTMFVPPGSTTPVKWGDYSKQYVPTSQIEAQKAKWAQEFVGNLAKTVGKGKAKPQTPPQNTQPQDFFADVRGLPMIDGQSLATLGERIQREGIGPLYEWAGKINGILEQVGKRLQHTERTAGTLVEGRSRGEFEGKMQTAAQSLAKEMFPGLKLDEHPVINDFVQDVYLSYDPNDPTLEAEFPNLLKSRMDGVLKLAAAINQAKLTQARELKRSFLRPGGQGQPSGQGTPERLSHRDIARNLFAADAGT